MLALSVLAESSNAIERVCTTAVAATKKYWPLVLTSCVICATTPSVGQDNKNKIRAEIPTEAGIRGIALELVEAPGSLIRWDSTLFPIKVLVAMPTTGAAAECASQWLRTLQETIKILNKDQHLVRLIVGDEDAPDISLLFVSIDSYREYAGKIERRIAPNNWKMMLEISDPIERFGLPNPWNNDAVFLVGDGRLVKLAVAFAELARGGSDPGSSFTPCVPEILATDLLKALFGQTAMLALSSSENRFGKGRFLDVVVPALGLVLQAQYRTQTQDAPSKEELLRQLSENLK